MLVQTQNEVTPLDWPHSARYLRDDADSFALSWQRSSSDVGRTICGSRSRSRRNKSGDVHASKALGVLRLLFCSKYVVRQLYFHVQVIISKHWANIPTLKHQCHTVNCAFGTSVASPRRTSVTFDHDVRYSECRRRFPKAPLTTSRCRCWSLRSPITLHVPGRRSHLTLLISLTAFGATSTYFAPPSTSLSSAFAL